MPGNKRPSYLKRQKEQKRNERAAAKREARQLKKRGKAAMNEGEPFEANDDGLGAGEMGAGEMGEDTSEVASNTDAADEGVATS